MITGNQIINYLDRNITFKYKTIAGRIDTKTVAVTSIYWGTVPLAEAEPEWVLAGFDMATKTECFYAIKRIQEIKEH